MYSTWILNTAISSEINEFLHLGTELEIYGKLASVPFCQVRASLFSMSSLRNTCMSSKQNFFVVLWVLVPGTGCMAAFGHVSYIIINAFCWAPGVKDGDQIDFAPDPGPPPAVQDAQLFLHPPFAKNLPPALYLVFQDVSFTALWMLAFNLNNPLRLTQLICIAWWVF